MATVIPSTGTMVSMGRIGSALGLYPSGSPSANLSLNATLGANRNKSLSGVAGIATGSLTQESLSFGGLSGSGTY